MSQAKSADILLATVVVMVGGFCKGWRHRVQLEPPAALEWSGISAGTTCSVVGGGASTATLGKRGQIRSPVTYSSQGQPPSAELK